jgi:phytoene desaturase
MRRTAIVIGSGVAGIASSIRLAKNGFEVTVFEANEFVGGKINSKTFNGYRFDMGPSVFTGPQYVEELYKLCGRDFSEFQYSGLEHSFNYFFPDGHRVKLPTDRKKLIEVMATEFGEDPNNIEKYLDKSKKNYNLIAPLFIEISLHKYRQLFNKKLISALANLPSYHLDKTMNEENKMRFKNPKTVQLFNRYASYNGSSPFKSPAMLNMISHLELNIGAFIPKEGMVQITKYLHQLAVDQGVVFRFNEKVEEILVENKMATGVKTKIGTYKADVVVCNMDVAYAYEKLLPNQTKPKKTISQEKSSSAIVFYFGIKKEFKELDLHNIFFSGNYEEEYNDIFVNKKLQKDPTIYINITSKYVKGDAPEGCENWFTMINSAIDTGEQNWEEVVKEARAIMINKINKQLNTNIEDLIEVEEVMHPGLIDQWYSGKHGSIYGNSSNNTYSAFYRHPNFSKHIKRLYFAGVTVHPGGGIPLALNSAKIAVRCAMEDLKEKVIE